jgi:hypothetical protein
MYGIQIYLSYRSNESKSALILCYTRSGHIHKLTTMFLSPIVHISECVNWGRGWGGGRVGIRPVDLWRHLVTTNDAKIGCLVSGPAAPAPPYLQMIGGRQLWGGGGGASGSAPAPHSSSTADWVQNRECWIISRGPGFSPNPLPPLPPISSTGDTQKEWKRDTTFDGGMGRLQGRAKKYDGEKAWSTMTIQYSLEQSQR